MANVPANNARPVTADRRRHTRSTLSGCRAYLASGLLGRLRGLRHAGYFPAVNLSRGGAMVLGAKPIPVGSVVRMRMEADVFIDPLRFKAKVIWTAKVNGRKVHRIGLQFLKVDKDSEGKLHALTTDPYLLMKPKNNAIQ